MEPLQSAEAVGEWDRVEQELDILRAIPACSCVSQSKYTGPQLNRMGVQLLLELAPNEKKKLINVHCSAQLDSKLKAALEVKRRVAALIGSDAVRAAEALRGAAASTASMDNANPKQLPTTEELEWLAEWVASQAAEVSAEEAEAALARRRANSNNVFIQLQRAQLLRAKVRAAELRLEKARAELSKAQLALEAEVGSEAERGKQVCL